MYHYLHHELLNKPKYSKHIVHIEGALHKLGLEGKTTKLGKYATLKESLSKILKESVTTLVVVGDDELLSNTISQLAPLKKQPVLGYMPVFESTPLTESLGIPTGEASVLSLAKRRIENINLAFAGDEFFINSVVVDASKVEVIINKHTTLRSSNTHEKLHIYNYTDFALEDKYSSLISAQDNLLEAVFLLPEKNRFSANSKMRVHSFFSAKHIELQPNAKSVSVLVDGSRLLKTPLEFGVSDFTISLIVGKHRAL